MKSKKILALDIGGSHIKANILDEQGNELEGYQSIKTPEKSIPPMLLKAIQKPIKNTKDFDLIAVGFPGYV